MGEVNRLIRHRPRRAVSRWRARWPLAIIRPRTRPVDLFLRPWEVDISRRTSLDSPLPVQVIEASPKGHYTQLVASRWGGITIR